jgi:DNA-binding HxlR family transcriptional regulator
MTKSASQMSKTKGPLPGTLVRGSKSGRPIMALFDLLGRRWTLRIIWELRDGKPRAFREIQELTGNLSPSILNTRMKELRQARVIELGPGGYLLTEYGSSLLTVLGSLDEWAKAWARMLERV